MSSVSSTAQLKYSSMCQIIYEYLYLDLVNCIKERKRVIHRGNNGQVVKRCFVAQCAALQWRASRRKHMNQKKVKKKTWWKKCAAEGRRGRVYLRQSWSQWSQRWGRLEQEMLLLPLMAAAWASCPLRHRAGTNYACLSVCHTHTHTHAPMVHCNLCALHTDTAVVNGI